MPYSWQDALLSTFAELPHHRGPHGEAARAYAIIDFRGHPDLLARIRATQDLSFGSIWGQTGLDIYADVAPLLIEIDGASQGCCGDRATLASTPCWCACWKRCTSAQAAATRCCALRRRFRWKS